MSLDKFLNEQKGVRRSILLISILWVSACVAVGLYHLTDLTAQSVAFLTLVVGLLQVPVAYYFSTRGKQ